jgi:hypothetical protein
VDARALGSRGRACPHPSLQLLRLAVCLLAGSLPAPPAALVRRRDTLTGAAMQRSEVCTPAARQNASSAEDRREAYPALRVSRARFLRSLPARALTLALVGVGARVALWAAQAPSGSSEDASAQDVAQRHGRHDVLLAEQQHAATAVVAHHHACSAVLEDEATLGHILAVGALSASELAAAAQVARVWRRVAAVDALWRAAWRSEAPSVRACVRGQENHEEEGSAGTTLSVRHWCSCTRRWRWRPARPRAGDGGWRTSLSSWTCRGRRRRARRSLPRPRPPRTQLDQECFCDAGTTLTFFNALPRNTDAGDAPPALCAQLLQPRTQSTAVGALRMRLLVRRSDGALACLLDGGAGVGLQSFDDVTTAAPRTIHILEVVWRSQERTEALADLRTRVQYVDNATQSHRVDLQLHLTVKDARTMWVEDGEAQPGPLFRNAVLLLSYHDEREQRAQALSHPEVLSALVRSNLRWVPRHHANTPAPAAAGTGSSGGNNATS